MDSLDVVTYVVGGVGVLGALLVAAGTLGILKSRQERRVQRAQLDQVSRTMESYAARNFSIPGAIDASQTDAEEPRARIDRLAKSLHESQIVIAELQAEMDAKVAALERLRAEEEQSRQLAALREEEARAVRGLVSVPIGIVINILF